ncbi:isoquinoline 1-oxidoreductase alpha subunit [Sphingomonas kaistensis]|uniref:Isoquinoline 1-oxidoreductase alpha subunit n=1 Tax=Sphingomonas kaistensis TaxID=298708 RepID=A0A7X5Y4J2_9SPHN|nr:2Fe-2S iron-sulfur cluster-binding protein [Sphingomonas kaistensis]NJC04578.1 isoquinoline 1-oxidoreductase alpha subunit [Sphingomonas kaistensis]
MARMRVNGQALEFALDPATPLLWALRDAANLTGTKQGCGGTGQCGACTVIVDGSAALSCTLAIGTLEGADVTTIEGLANHPLTLALIAEDAIQCGFCLPGFTCAVAALLQQSPRPAAEQIDALPNRCACGMQPRLRRAIERVAGAGAPEPSPTPPAPPQTPEIVSPPR